MSKPKVVAIVQARMGSSRLPGKVLLDLESCPVLGRVVNRLQRCKQVDEIVIATSDNSQDDAIESLCKAQQWLCFRGSESDVLDRFCRAAECARANVVVRVTADCPLIDPQVTDEVIQAFLSRSDDVDHVSNVLPTRTFPRGLDVEAFSRELLTRCEREDSNPAWREHVTELVFQRPEQFRVHCVTYPRDYSFMRWTLDTPSDLELIRLIYRHFGNDEFSWLEIVKLFEEQPQLLGINRDVVQKIVT